jgi:transcriptional regulator with XRE-family HTH domain
MVPLLSEYQYLPVNRPLRYFLGMAKHVLPHTLASRIFEARGEAGLTQVQLATKAKIGQSALSSLETGETLNPRAGTLLRLARATGVEALWLESEEPPKRLDSSPEEWQMRDLWLLLDQSNRRALLASAKGMLADQTERKPKLAYAYPIRRKGAKRS